MSKAKATRREVVMFSRYLAIRGISLAVALVVGMLIVVYIANLGGRVDEIVKNEIQFNINNLRQNRDYMMRLQASCEALCGGHDETCVKACIEKHFEDLQWQEIVNRGLDKPFEVRLFYYLRDALTLRLGVAMWLHSDAGSPRVWDIISERLPNTVILFTTTNLVIFFIQLFLGLMLSRKYGTIYDKIAVSVAPLSSMPGWFYGLFLLIIFAFILRILPDGGMYTPNPEDYPALKALYEFNYSLGRVVDLLWHMILPMMSWLVAYIPIGVYYYRTFFLMFSTEEFVEYARARGVPPRIIERRYILRTTLPPIITSLVLMIISSWMGAIITERIFRWPGLGTVLAMAIDRNDAPVIIGIIAIYAYLLVISVFILDLIYGIVDPRVRVIGGERR